MWSNWYAGVVNAAVGATIRYVQPDHEVIVIGSGFSGIGAGIKLKEAGVDDFPGAGIEGMIKGRRTDVPGLANRTLVGPLGRHTPRALELPSIRSVVGRALGLAADR